MKKKGKMIKGILFAMVMMGMVACGNAETNANFEASETEEDSESTTEETMADTDLTRDTTAPVAEQENPPTSEEQSEEVSVDEEEQGDTFASESNGALQGVFPVKMVKYNAQYPEEREEYFYDAEGYPLRIISLGNDYTAETEYEYLTDERGNKVYGIDLFYYSDRGGWNINDKAHILLKSTKGNSGNRSTDYLYEYDDDFRIVSREMSDLYDDTPEWNTHESIKYKYEKSAEGWNVNIDYEFNGETHNPYIMMQFDSIGNVVSYVQNDDFDNYGDERKYVYDENGNMVKEIVAGGGLSETYSYSYDTAGNMLSCISSNQKLEYEGYDENGKWTMYTCYEGEELVFFVCREYDQDGNLISASRMVGTDEVMAQYEYDEKGRLASVSVGDQILQELSYNADGLLEKITCISNYEEDEHQAIYAVFAMSYVLNAEEWVEKYTGIKNAVGGFDLGTFNMKAGDVITFEY